MGSICLPAGSQPSGSKDLFSSFQCFSVFSPRSYTAKLVLVSSAGFFHLCHEKLKTTFRGGSENGQLRLEGGEASPPAAARRAPRATEAFGATPRSPAASLPTHTRPGGEAGGGGVGFGGGGALGFGGGETGAGGGGGVGWFWRWGRSCGFLAVAT